MEGARTYLSLTYTKLVTARGGRRGLGEELLTDFSSQAVTLANPVSSIKEESRPSVLNSWSPGPRSLP
ncbi:hypothetical protein FOZ60_013018 [Perkinsus olseni]|uniref:Uncharacterized protein n=1 Tax=Perkinsus olseni TaxID=32597 RepID=A0A7J6NB90_PEROL|nr:hypothetical protein FOZ60_013018 [Perkinsus olseni]